MSPDFYKREVQFPLIHALMVPVSSRNTFLLDAFSVTCLINVIIIGWQQIKCRGLFILVLRYLTLTVLSVKSVCQSVQGVFNSDSARRFFFLKTQCSKPVDDSYLSKVTERIFSCNLLLNDVASYLKRTLLQIVLN